VLSCCRVKDDNFAEASAIDVLNLGEVDDDAGSGAGTHLFGDPAAEFEEPRPQRQVAADPHNTGFQNKIEGHLLFHRVLQAQVPDEPQKVGWVQSK